MTEPRPGWVCEHFLVPAGSVSEITDCVITHCRDIRRPPVVVPFCRWGSSWQGLAAGSGRPPAAAVCAEPRCLHCCCQQRTGQHRDSQRTASENFDFKSKNKKKENWSYVTCILLNVGQSSVTLKSRLKETVLRGIKAASHVNHSIAEQKPDFYHCKLIFILDDGNTYSPLPVKNLWSRVSVSDGKTSGFSKLYKNYISYPWVSFLILVPNP